MFPRTNLIIGVGSVFNVAGNYYEFNRSSTDEEADSKAIESDWGTIGKDLENVFNNEPKEQLPKLKMAI